MGYYCVFVQIRERTLMDLPEDDVTRLFERAAEPARRYTSLGILEQYEWPAMAGEPVPPMSLEKMWIDVHHLLTGWFRPVPSPLSRAILGGMPIGADVGIGPVRYVWADEVREISSALSSLTHDDLRRRYAPRELKESYESSIHEDEDDEDVFAVLVGCFHLLATYYRIAAARGNAMLIGIT